MPICCLEKQKKHVVVQGRSHCEHVKLHEYETGFAVGRNQGQKVTPLLEINHFFMIYLKCILKELVKQSWPAKQAFSYHIKVPGKNPSIAALRKCVWVCVITCLCASLDLYEKCNKATVTEADRAARETRESLKSVCVCRVGRVTLKCIPLQVRGNCTFFLSVTWSEFQNIEVM